MIGIKFSDFGDLPESYGMAEHYLRTQSIDYDTKAIKQIQQPYLGKIKADKESTKNNNVKVLMMLQKLKMKVYINILLQTMYISTKIQDVQKSN